MIVLTEVSTTPCGSIGSASGYKENTLLGTLWNPAITKRHGTEKIKFKNTFICRFYWLLLATGQNIRFGGVNWASRPSKSILYSGVSFHISYCNSAGLSDVFRHNRVFVIAWFVKAGSTVMHSSISCALACFYTHVHASPGPGSLVRKKGEWRLFGL